MRYLSVCSGIEAASVAWHPLGFSPVAFAEIDPFACAVLRHHYPDVPNWGDLTKFREWPDACDCDSRHEQSKTATTWRWLEGRRDDVHVKHARSAHDRVTTGSGGSFCARCDGAAIDLLVGGTPCQSFSVAGLRAGLADPRGNLALTYLAVADRYRPRWLVWENVPGVLSSNDGRAMGSFLGGLAELGYGFAYRVLDAQYFGLAQRRKRVFVVGHLGDWRRAAAVLFDGASLSGHPAPRRETREGAAARALCRTDGGIDREDRHTLIPQVVTTIAGALTARASRNGGAANDDVDQGRLVAHALRADGFDAGEDGTGRGTPLVPICLRADAVRSGEARTPSPDATGRVRLRDAGFNVCENFAPTLDASAPHVVAFDTIAFADVADPVAPNQARTYTREGAHNFRLSNVAIDGWRVRRLTPLECERLQGFPDNHTLIPYRGKPAKDGPRYKALGNSMAVPCMRWIGERIQLVDAIEACGASSGG